MPDWNGTVHIGTVSAKEREEFESWVRRNADKDGVLKSPSMRALFVAMAARNPDGSRMFTNADVEALNQRSAGALDVLFNAAFKHNKMLAGDVEELEKNSVSGHGAAS